MVRFRSIWPPPQDTVHLVQSSHSFMRQSTRGLFPQSIEAVSLIPGLQGSTALSPDSEQRRPLPEAKTVTCRLRSRMPKHSQLQCDHSPQEESSQSRSSMHGGRSSQTANSSLRPYTGLPQGLGNTSIVRRRDLYPLEHVAEHDVHSIHSDQRPSVHSSSQAWVPQGATSIISAGSQGVPPLAGCTATSRLRRMWPPPQEAVHWDQPIQLPHWQPMLTSSIDVLQGSTSTSGPSHPCPLFVASVSTIRSRVLEPFP
mmetsp:Transcript_124604/g.265791  ORF Transcript_124604/g.265791 Transcript_124604/m.265791 type:complete len:256 (-) Transcript_124604:1210-1977(-)